MPSPATSYDWIDPINYYPRYSKGDLDFKTITEAENTKNSNYIREKIELFSNKNDIQFIDLTKKIREETKTNVLHGPKTGYISMQVVINLLQKILIKMLFYKTKY